MVVRGMGWGENFLADPAGGKRGGIYSYSGEFADNTKLTKKKWVYRGAIRDADRLTVACAN